MHRVTGAACREGVHGGCAGVALSARHAAERLLACWHSAQSTEELRASMQVRGDRQRRGAVRAERPVWCAAGCMRRQVIA